MFFILADQAFIMRCQRHKQYFIWVVINNNPLSLLHGEESYMPLEIAIEKILSYIRLLSDSIDWKEVPPQGYEAVKWVNGKGDKILISESVQT
jgi:hypothetical protein